MGVQWFIKRLEDLENDKLIEFMQECLNDNNKFITDLNKKQLEKGIKSDRSYMKEYSYRTIKQRQLEGNPVKGELIALYDTGNFWKGFWAIATDGKLELLSSDSKTNELISRYGENIFGLTESNFEILGEKIMPQLKQKVINYLKA